MKFVQLAPQLGLELIENRLLGRVQPGSDFVQRTRASFGRDAGNQLGKLVSRIGDQRKSGFDRALQGFQLFARLLVALDLRFRWGCIGCNGCIARFSWSLRAQQRADLKRCADQQIQEFKLSLKVRQQLASRWWGQCRRLLLSRIHVDHLRLTAGFPDSF